MNCQEALDLLYDIIDKEASDIDTQQVQEHLSHCRDCFEKYKVEGAVHDFIKAKLNSDTSGPRLEVLKSRIISRLDTIDQEREGNRGRPPFWNMTFTLAIAAFVVVTVGAAYLVAGLFTHNDLYMPFEKAHFAAAEGNGLSSERLDGTLKIVNHDLHYTLENEVGTFALASGHMEEIRGKHLAHFVYRQGDKLISVFLAPATQLEIPENLRKTLVQRNGFDLFDHHCRGCRLVYRRDGDVIVVTATTDRQTDLLDFLPGHSTI